MFALGEAADARAIPAHYQPASVVLEFVNQHGPDGGRATFDGRWGFGETLGKLKYMARVAAPSASGCCCGFALGGCL